MQPQGNTVAGCHDRSSIMENCHWSEACPWQLTTGKSKTLKRLHSCISCTQSSKEVLNTQLHCRQLHPSDLLAWLLVRLHIPYWPGQNSITQLWSLCLYMHTKHGCSHACTCNFTSCTKTAGASMAELSTPWCWAYTMYTCVCSLHWLMVHCPQHISSCDAEWRRLGLLL